LLFSNSHKTASAAADAYRPKVDILIINANCYYFSCNYQASPAQNNAYCLPCIRVHHDAEVVAWSAALSLESYTGLFTFSIDRRDSVILRISAVLPRIFNRGLRQFFIVSVSLHFASHLMLF